MKLKESIHGLPIAFAGGDDTSLKEVQVLRTGTFNHPKFGRIEITPTDLLALKENFEKGVRRVKTPFNYEHGDDPTRGKKSAGSVVALSLKNNGTELWAKPRWTATAKAEIQAEEWLYLSAEFFPHWKDPESEVVHKNVLVGVALTNTPFIKGMQQIAASEPNITNERNQPMKLSEITSLLLSEHSINLSDLQTKVVQLGEQITTLTGTNKALETKNAELTQKLELSEKAADKVKFDALVKKGMDDGKLTKAFVDSNLSKYFESNGLKFCEDLVAGMQKVVNTAPPVGHDGQGQGGGEPQKFSDPAKEIERLADALIEKSDGKLSFSEAMSTVRKANPDLDKAYKAAALKGNANDDTDD